MHNCACANVGRYGLACRRREGRRGTGFPRYTPGTLSYVIPVKDQGKTVMVAYSGGTLTGAFGSDGAKWDEYIASQKKIAKAAADAGASVILSNHSEYDGAYTRRG